MMIGTLFSLFKAALGQQHKKKLIEIVSNFLIEAIQLEFVGGPEFGVGLVRLKQPGRER